MNKIKTLCVVTLMFSFLTVGCFNLNKKQGSSSNEEQTSQSENQSSESSSGEKESSSSSTIIEKKVTVNFYLDFNQLESKNIYYTTEVDNGGLITSLPPTPTVSNYPDFPVFKGWSKKEIIDDVNDLWDFSSDTVVANSGTLNLFGIWVAEGE